MKQPIIMKSTIFNYLSGKSSEKEQKELLDLMREDAHIADFKAIKKEWKAIVKEQNIAVEHQENWQNIQRNIVGRLQKELTSTRRSLSFFKYVAMVAILISLPALFYYTLKADKTPQLVYTTVVADNGQISKVMLPDSTAIWINSGSKIRYNNQFSETNRSIELVGEAFFDVVKNSELPMIVHANNLEVKVLGTEFNVKAYPEERNVQIVLERGKVELFTEDHPGAKYEMKPGEMVNFDKEKQKLTISKVNVGLYTSWKDGMINIYNLSLKELVIKLEKRYNQKFIVDEEIQNLPYTFTIKNENLESILSLMEVITPVDVVQKNNVIELRYNKSKKKR